MRHGAPALLIVSSDWFARELLRSAAGETDVFGAITAVEDGHSALVEIWQGVIDGHAPPNLLIDLHEADPSTARLAHALRGDADTRDVYVAVLVPPEAQSDLPGMVSPEVNLVTGCATTSDELPSVMMEIGRQICAHAAWR